MKARCMKCKIDVEPVDTAIVSMNNKKRPNAKMLKGKCPNCKTTVCRMLKKEESTNG